MIIDHGGLQEAEMFKVSEERAKHLCKVNLRYKDGENGEGIWAIPCTEADVALYEGDTIGQTFYVWLCNDPICPDVRYGSKVACLTNGGSRPYSLELSSPKGLVKYEAAINKLRTLPRAGTAQG